MRLPWSTGGSDVKLAAEFGAELVAAVVTVLRRDGRDAGMVLATVEGTVRDAAAGCTSDPHVAGRLARSVLDLIGKREEAESERLAAAANEECERAEARAERFAKAIYVREHGLLERAYQEAHREVLDGSVALTMDFETTDPPPQYVTQLHYTLEWFARRAVERELLDRYGEEYSVVGLRRALNLLHDEYEARRHGLSVERFRTLKHEEAEALASAPRISIFDLFARERAKEAAGVAPHGGARYSAALALSESPVGAKR
jgi:hypothetical protein